jgi:hypothetical protein
MDASKVKELQAIHKDLAAYLKAEHEAIGNCLLTVAALRKAVETHTGLRVVYRAKVQELSEDEIFQAGLSPSNRLESLLRRLKDW